MLKLFTFDCSNLGLFQPFLSSLISIKHLNIYPKIFEKILPIKNLTNLIQSQTQLTSLSLFSLNVNSHQISGIGLLIQKVGNHLEHLELGIWEDTKRKKAFESIINYCDEIKFLHLSYIDLDNIHQLY